MLVWLSISNRVCLWTTYQAGRTVYFICRYSCASIVLVYSSVHFEAPVISPKISTERQRVVVMKWLTTVKQASRVRRTQASSVTVSCHCPCSPVYLLRGCSGVIGSAWRVDGRSMGLGRLRRSVQPSTLQHWLTRHVTWPLWHWPPRRLVNLENTSQPV